jgi:hypothetical protein
MTVTNSVRSERAARLGPQRELRARTLDDIEWLRDQYLTQRTFIRDIAQLSGVSERTARAALRAAGLSKRASFEPPPPKPVRRVASKYSALNDREWLQAFINVPGVSIRRIADVVGCNHQTIRSALR